MDGEVWWAAVHGVAKSRTQLNDFPFTFHFHALEKELTTHSSVLAWRIPGMAESDGLPSLGSHRVGHDWSDLAAAAADVTSVEVSPAGAREQLKEGGLAWDVWQGNFWGQLASEPDNYFLTFAWGSGFLIIFQVLAQHLMVLVHFILISQLQLHLLEAQD